MLTEVLNALLEKEKPFVNKIRYDLWSTLEPDYQQIFIMHHMQKYSG